MLSHSFFSSRWFVFKETLRNRTKVNSHQRPVLVLSIRQLKQRYLYLLAQSFLKSGFFVILDMPINRECFWETDAYARYVFEEPQLKVASFLSIKRPQAVLCLDHDGIDSSGWSKVIRINYDILEGLASPEAVVAPYWMHPNAYKSSLNESLDSLRHRPKTLRMFFAGNLSRQRYTYRGPLNRNKLTRIDVLEYVLTEFRERTLLVQDPGELKGLLDGGYQNKIIIFDGTQARLSREEWFPALSRCEYFLALPGVMMPMSHNLIEAMALGCIPVCNYPEWLSPRLIHADNCLAFEGKESLGQAIEEALSADAEVISRLRAGAVDYFLAHLQPSAFIEPLLRSRHRLATCYVNAEQVSEKAALGSCPPGRSCPSPGEAWEARV